MAIARVAHTAAQGSTSTVTTAAINTTGASLIVSIVADILNVVTTDSAGNTWTRVTSGAAGANVFSNMYYVRSPTTSASHTFTQPGSSNAFPGLAILAYSGTAGLIDGLSFATTTGATSLATGSVAPTVDNDVLVFGLGFNATNTIAVSVGAIVDQLNFVGGTSFGVVSAEEIQTTKTTRNQSFSWGSSASAVATAAAFSAPAAGGGGMLVHPGMSGGARG